MGKHTMDNTFFGVTKSSGDSITYMTRKNFERSFEALLDAGLLNFLMILSNLLF